jgi:hypothetical protein
VLFTDGGASLGSMSVTTNNPQSYSDPNAVKLVRYQVAPAALFQFNQDIGLEFWLKLNSAVGVPDGQLVLNVNGSQTYRNDAMITGKVSTGAQGDPYRPLTLFKFGEQATGTGPFSELRYIDDGLLIEKV